MERIVNEPIAKTFSWLSAGGTKANVPDTTTEDSLVISAGETRTLIIKEEAAFTKLNVQLEKDARFHLIQIPAPSDFSNDNSDISATESSSSETAVTSPSNDETANTLYEAPADTAAAEISVICGKNAQFHWYRLVSGREKTYDNCSVRLQGAGSKFTAAIGYRLCGTQVYDLNCEAIHLGKNTESSIRSSGVLDGQADKIMRGTIDFQTGAAGSIGNETEDVLLLSETVRNRSIPVILCAEEEVVGNHGASIGRPDENVLYYLQSRGIEEEEALQLIANAKLFSVIDKIPDAELREQLVSNMELN